MSATNDQPTVSEFTITMRQVQDFEFQVRFDNAAFDDLKLDEPAPLGRDSAPNAARILAAAIGNCLSASLLFCSRKAKVPTGPIEARVTTQVARNDKGRLRIIGVEVELDPNMDADARARAARCVDLFEDFCMVTQSVRQGIPVQVKVVGFETDLPPAA